MYGSLPMGIEEQVTVWGYNSAGLLGSMMFKRYVIINKSNTPLEEMYISIWNDPDVGDATDDFVGCDTVLSLTYAYNATPMDAVYGNQPPAVGYDFLQGPIYQEIQQTRPDILIGIFLEGKICRLVLTISLSILTLSGEILHKDNIRELLSGIISYREN